MADSLIKVLMSRDDIDMSEAQEMIEEMRERILSDGDDPEELLYEIGLEPDYVFDLI